MKKIIEFFLVCFYLNRIFIFQRKKSLLTDIDVELHLFTNFYNLRIKNKSKYFSILCLESLESADSKRHIKDVIFEYKMLS